MDWKRIAGYLNVENHQLLDEVNRLARIAHERSYPVRQGKLAYDDALLMAQLYCAGVYPSRRYLERHYGISQTRHRHAFRLLKLARAVRNKWYWVTDDITQIEQALRGLDSRRNPNQTGV
jgi:hypothetical protein